MTTRQELADLIARAALATAQHPPRPGGWALAAADAVIEAGFPVEEEPVTITIRRVLATDIALNQMNQAEWSELRGAACEALGMPS